MSLGGRLNYVAQPSDQQVGNNAYQPLPQFTGDDPYSQIMAMMPGFRNPYANASSGNALGGFDPSIYARNYSSSDAVNGGGGGGGGAGPIMGGSSVGNVMPGIIDPYDQAGQDAIDKINREIVDTDDELGYLTGNTPEPMPTPVNDDELGYITGADDELGYLTGNSPEPTPASMPDDPYPYPSEPMQEPMVMPYEPADYNYGPPAEPTGGDFRGEMGRESGGEMGGDFGGGFEDTGYGSVFAPASPGDFGGDFGGSDMDTSVGQMAGYAKGGMVHGLLGPNPKGPDDGAGFLDRGEYVIRKSSVKKYGRGLLDMINEGKVPAKKIKSLLD